jgi:hypothetical protein
MPSHNFAPSWRRRFTGAAVARVPAASISLAYRPARSEEGLNRSRPSRATLARRNSTRFPCPGCPNTSRYSATDSRREAYQARSLLSGNLGTCRSMIAPPCWAALGFASDWSSATGNGSRSKWESWGVTSAHEWPHATLPDRPAAPRDPPRRSRAATPGASGVASRPRIACRPSSRTSRGSARSARRLRPPSTRDQPFLCSSERRAWVPDQDRHRRTQAPPSGGRGRTHPALRFHPPIARALSRAMSPTRVLKGKCDPGHGSSGDAISPCDTMDRAVQCFDGR